MLCVCWCAILHWQQQPMEAGWKERFFGPTQVCWVQDSLGGTQKSVFTTLAANCALWECFSCVETLYSHSTFLKRAPQLNPIVILWVCLRQLYFFSFDPYWVPASLWPWVQLSVLHIYTSFLTFCMWYTNIASGYYLFLEAYLPLGFL